MSKILTALAFAAVALTFAYGAYLWGWYEGSSHYAVESGLSDAKISLSAAQSLRARDPQLALELLEANIAWMDTSLTFEGETLRDEQRGDYDIVMQRLERYKTAYAMIGSR